MMMCLSCPQVSYRESLSLQGISLRRIPSDTAIREIDMTHRVDKSYWNTAERIDSIEVN